MPTLQEVQEELTAIEFEKLNATRALRNELDLINSRYTRKKYDIVADFFLNSVSDERVLELIDPFDRILNERNTVEKIKYVRNEIYLAWGMHAPLRWVLQFVKRNF